MSDIITDLTEKKFEAAISTGVCLVDFWAPWCGPCKMQTPILEDQVAPAIAGRAKIYKVNVDEAAELARQFKVRSIPTLMIFKDGALVQQLVGMQRGEALVAALEEALA